MDKLKKLFRDCRKALDEKPEKIPKKNSDETQVEYNRRSRQEKREALLCRLVGDRICMFCGRVKSRSRQWVILDRHKIKSLNGSELHKKLLEQTTVICRSCFNKFFS